MDGSRFDDLTRAMVSTRRGALRTFVGGAVAGVAALIGGASPGSTHPPGVEAGDDVDEPRHRRAARPKRPYRRAGKHCDSGQPCGERAPCTNGICTPLDCLIDGEVYALGELNPSNPCQFCIPYSFQDGLTWNRWLGVVGDGEACELAEEGSCLTSKGTCQDVQCVRDPLSDGIECGPDRVCCGGGCCAEGEVCGASGCEAPFDGCEIAGQRYDAGDPNPDHDCEVCNPARSTTEWSPADDGSVCGGVAGRVCCNGSCCSPTECCNPQGVCEECGCEIDGTAVPAGAPNPDHDCQVCDPDRNRFAWSPVDDFETCGGVAGRVCCNGECCSPTECCNPVGFCEECGPHCRIDNEDVDAGTPHPTDPCLACDPENDPFGWSPGPDDVECGGLDEGDRICCAGVCCPSGDCCNEGVCGECQCRILGFPWDEGAHNPFDRCQICDPDRDRNSWSSALDGAPCGDTDDRECCTGACCPRGECCNAVGECEPCPCSIGTDTVVDGGINPDNTCQICDSGQDREHWTTLPDHAACGGPDDDRVCCGGTCCAQGECCDGGACQPCGCEIDGDDSIAPNTVNEVNSCQICDPSRARLAWSPVDDGTVCGSDGGHCCGGDCCPADQCCILEACGDCICSIENETLAPEARNPANSCEICDPKTDPFAWTVLPDNAACGELGVGLCCAGTCCAADECCLLGVCAPCGCEIGDEQVAEGTLNPENNCEICDPVLNRTGWSPNADDTACGANGTEVCCGGVCCPPGQCCSLAGACEPCRCTIDGAVVEAEARNPVNPCEVCDPAASKTAWTLLPDDAACGEGQVCCNAVCCAAGECCVLGICAPCGCEIGGERFDDGAINPANVCQVCDPVADRNGWSPVTDGSSCGATGGQVCCGGACCPDGQCCSLAGACKPCDGCTIDGVQYEAGTPNPRNRFCEVCDPSRSTTSWSAGPDGFPCALDAPQVCCAGVCCGPNECCNAATGLCDPNACAPEVCTIDGVVYDNFTLNPQNECEHCDAFKSTTSWSYNGFAHCGPTGQQFCNAHGACCPLGHCPDMTVPGFCGDFCDGVCVIAGVLYFTGDRNPAEPCQVCAPNFSHEAWTTICSDACCGHLPCDHCS